MNNKCYVSLVVLILVISSFGIAGIINFIIEILEVK